ncbi:MAG: diacylglycerol kinase family protein [Rhodococcus sp. (in: high G+C Gram-positive bacteria)]|uniref:diacylglycerol/lipid kinase family protein n=1 Tax=Rhodococcus sp. EPR-157 TaxID=1813677 RepID=UPI0007BB3CB2|nr:diacylglycerol kinase family protein [Rhodococcus sp. EPR-157]KZF04564.1 diacylglycerol kinase [Rhodococcus sp. EPR-157]
MNESDFADVSDHSRRWWARGAFVLAVAAAVVPVLFAGVLGTVALLVVEIGGVVVTVASLYSFLTRRGVLRWITLGVAIATPVIVLAVFVRANLLWVVVLVYVLALAASVCARAALRRSRAETDMPEYPASPAKHPFVIMNPHSGGGKVAQFDLRRKAEALGADVALLEGPGTVDVTALARQAVEQGADLLGVAGGDGTQALVAAVAAEHDLPFLVISAGTRNHFAMDLGLDRSDPARSLDALRDGVELRVDLGAVDGRPFVNNVSFGVYAEIVRSPAYRDDKAATVLKLLPDLLTGHSGPRLVAHIGDTEVEEPQAVLVSNNAYGTSDVAGLSRRDRLDRGVLGVVTLSVANTRQAVDLLRRNNGRGLTQTTAREVTVDSDTPEIPVGVDGESLLLRTPVRCTVDPGALRVLVPRNRPGVRVSAPVLDWGRLWQTAFPS